MKQAISNAIPTEDSQVSRRTLLTRFSWRMGLFLTAALLMIMGPQSCMEMMLTVLI
jgi:hypothetical protein